jgi:uncharacterized protein
LIAVDTNILVYAHRADAQWHATAARVVRELAEGTAAWAIPWPCVHEFFSIVTHPRIYSPPSTLSQALGQVGAWMESPVLSLLSEEPGYYGVLEETLRMAKVSGPRVHDARIAALCIHHGVRQLWSADRDFGSFARIEVENPLV